MRRFMIVVVVGLFITAIVATPASATVPDTISFQGRLTDTGGVLLNGNYNITLRIYDAPTGGNLLWTEANTNVAVVNGIHNIYMGNVTSLAGLAFDRPYWISIEVNGGGEMTPRRPMTTAPYAFRAKYADSVANISTLDAVYINTSGDTMTGPLVVQGRIKGETFATDYLTSASGSDTVNVINNVLINGGIHVRGNATIDTILALGDTVTIIDNLRINGGIHIQGNVRGNAFSGDGAGLTNLSVGSLDTSGLATANHHHDTAYVNVTGDSMSGSLQITGDLIVSGTVDGVDISTHAGNSNAHHMRYTDTEVRTAVVAAPIVGTVTATAFSGDGSGLTGINASGGLNVSTFSFADKVVSAGQTQWDTFTLNAGTANSFILLIDVRCSYSAAAYGSGHTAQFIYANGIPFGPAQQQSSARTIGGATIYRPTPSYATASNANEYIRPRVEGQSTYNIGIGFNRNDGDANSGTFSNIVITVYWLKM